MSIPSAPKLLVVALAVVVATPAARAQPVDEDHERHLQELERWRERQGRARGARPPATAPRDETGATPRAAGSTDHRHLGFYLRFDLGFGAMQATSSGGDFEKNVLTGTAGAFGLHLGGAVAEDFIIAFHLLDAVAVNPTSKQGGAQEATDMTVTLLGYGLELTWYFMPANWYLSITPALTQVTQSDAAGSIRSKSGFGARLAIGKEWWVSSHWGLGATLHGTFSRNAWPEPRDGLRTDALSAGLALSATYN